MSFQVTIFRIVKGLFFIELPPCTFIRGCEYHSGASKKSIFTFYVCSNKKAWGGTWLEHDLIRELQQFRLCCLER